MSSQRQTDSAQKRILVCLSSSVSNARVIHSAAKIASAFQGTLTAIYVETPTYAAMSDDDKKRLHNNMNLAESLGATLETVTGDDVAYQISEFARLSGISEMFPKT